jgi:hypothetical protein
VDEDDADAPAASEDAAVEEHAVGGAKMDALERLRATARITATAASDGYRQRHRHERSESQQHRLMVPGRR